MQWETLCFGAKRAIVDLLWILREKRVRRGYGLELETSYAVGILGELFEQNLDRHIPSKLLVLGLVDLSHAVSLMPDLMGFVISYGFSNIIELFRRLKQIPSGGAVEVLDLTAGQYSSFIG